MGIWGKAWENRFSPASPMVELATDMLDGFRDGVDDVARPEDHEPCGDGEGDDFEHGRLLEAKVGQEVFDFLFRRLGIEFWVPVLLHSLGLFHGFEMLKPGAAVVRDQQQEVVGGYLQRVDRE